MKRTFRVTVEIPKGVEVADVAAFISDSIAWAGGCRHPDDPFFTSLKNNKVVWRNGNITFQVTDE